MSYLGLVAKYIFEKHCFIYASRTLFHSRLQSDEQVQVFKAILQNEQTAFFSCHFKLPTNQDKEFQINGLYANKLGIKEEDEIILEPVKYVPFCESVFVDPLSVNDWEILEKNAHFIEAHLLEQVRVVWEGQVLPIWVHQSVCLFLKIGKIKPTVECALLRQETEVIVSRFSRLGSIEKKMTEHTTKNNLFKNPRKLNVGDMAPLEDMSQSLSLYSGLFQYFQSFFMWTTPTVTERQPAENIPEKTEFFPDSVSMTLRVQGLTECIEMPKHVLDSNNSLKLKHFLKNPDIVFVSIGDIIDQCSVLKSIPRIFFAKLIRLQSPKELSQSQTGKSSAKENNLSNNVVQVRVVGNSERICEEGSSPSIFNEKNVLEGHVMVPNALRFIEQLELTSRVELQGIRAYKIKLRYLYIKPIRVTLFGLQESLDRLDEKTTRKAFELWINKTTTLSQPMIVFDKKLIRFRIKKKTDYWVEAILSFSQNNHNAKCQEELVYAELYPEALKSTQIIIQNEVDRSRQSPKIQPSFLALTEIDPRVGTIKLSEIKGLQTQISKALLHFHMCLSNNGSTSMTLSRSSQGILLITGATGSGKTTLASAICKELLEPPTLAYPLIISCKSLVGKKISSIRTFLEQQFEEASWRQPAIVVLDDLDCLCSRDTDIDMDPLENIRLSSVVCDMLKKLLISHSSVGVIATSESRMSLHQKLISSRGTHYIQLTINIPYPEQKTREEILESLLESNLAVHSDVRKQIDLKKIAAKAEGFVVQDLKKIVNRAIHSHLQQKQSDYSESYSRLQLDLSQLQLKQEDFDQAFIDFSPLSLRGIELHNSEASGWSDVGGLDDVKSLLMETFVWPSKYPNLFSKCPIRRRSGVLLFGAPGTGKTLIVAALAKECRMNFITIKGPELLNKYVGASEQAVRDTFNRARKAKPCIIFFDEFDSLAPRRGNDSTGTTDRVVNQLLTQLDGVECLEGVFVIGATSRPDLIDPALLRPGRFDKCMSCDIPSKDDRLSILKVLTSKMHLAPDVKLDFFADICQHFTGADLKALLYNAQLVAIHESMEKPKNKPQDDNQKMNEFFTRARSWSGDKKNLAKMNLIYIPNLETGCTEPSPQLEEKVEKEVIRKKRRVKNRRESLMPPSEKEETIIVKHEHINKAYQKMKPSVSTNERCKYETIYNSFSKRRDFNPIAPTFKQEYMMA
ncbi:peroxisomal ATPase PEX1 isoform X1 [Octopus bimaculoides]|nr:peroxisomal ATPase PEX1 isoform X1 [Octopus bimaculoides]